MVSIEKYKAYITMTEKNKKQSQGITYAEAGVNIAVADSTKAVMREKLETSNPRVLNRVGAFASLIDGVFPEMNHPVLVLKMEEPGSKQLLAAQHGKLAGVGYDLVNHLINDVIVMGAKPIALLDTIVCGKLEKDVVLSLITAMADACKKEGCDIVGGETSEQPRVIPSGAYILSASALGVVDKNKIIDGSKITPGDIVVGIASNGVHTNGYSLIRSLLDKDPTLAKKEVEESTFLEAVLKPHLCYNTALQEAFSKININGLAHITGGGIAGNLVRILPPNARAVIQLKEIETLPVFKIIREAGEVSDEEMLKSFNVGVGLVAVVSPSEVEKLQEIFSDYGNKTFTIGEITSGPSRVVLEGFLKW